MTWSAEDARKAEQEGWGIKTDGGFFLTKFPHCDSHLEVLSMLTDASQQDDAMAQKALAEATKRRFLRVLG